MIHRGPPLLYDQHRWKERIAGNYMGPKKIFWQTNNKVRSDGNSIGFRMKEINDMIGGKVVVDGRKRIKGNNTTGLVGMSMEFVKCKGKSLIQC